MNDDPAQTIAGVIADMYSALGDRPAFDRHLDPEITIWESDAGSMLSGIGELDRLRDSRAASADPSGVRPDVRPEELRTDVWGDTAVTRYLLRVRHADTAGSDMCFRVTDVLRHHPVGWQIVHHHSELVRP